MNRIKVLVVDDSAFMRKAIENMLKKDPEIEVAGFARNGKDAIEKIEELKPDIVTLDIEMPIMDGLSALKKIMSTNPIPVIMVSSLTTEGAEATIEALDAGALDFIPKDKSFATFGIMKIEKELIEKVKYFARKKVFRPKPQKQEKVQIATKQTARMPAPQGPKKSIVAIGTSTGGPQSLQKVIPALPGDLGKPVLIVQHMPPNFTKSLATRLNSLSQLEVVEAQGKEKLEPGVVFIAKGGFQLKVRRVGSNYYTEIVDDSKNVLHIPSVDVMVSSVADNFGSKALGVIMTGMGSDGLKGVQLLKSKGGAVIAQDKDSCVVYGMPRAVIEANLADAVVPLGEIAHSIVQYCK
jgi:two-component system chemotaxis response regulator CheB